MIFNIKFESILFELGWLEPLIDPIARNPNVSTVPAIHTISHKDFSFMYDLNMKDTDIAVGGFDWGLIHNWHAFPEREKKRRNSRIDFIQSPTMVGKFALPVHFIFYLN
jgi:polypeptide N-acetylgalactosaminyltransferase